MSKHDCKTDDRKLAIDRPCSACSEDPNMEYHDHCPPFREGVAAPLEPSPPINTFFRKHLAWHEKKLLPWQENVIIVAEAYAAAVSKNLTDKYAEMEAKWMRELLTVSNEIRELREHCISEHDCTFCGLE